MRIAFVGIEKDWTKLYEKNYDGKFVKYHLELPYYFAKYGNNCVWIITNDPLKIYERQFSNTSFIMTEDYKYFAKRDFDVVVHWRKWLEDCYKPGAINVINSQDHSYSHEWKHKVSEATKNKRLHGITCFPGWHENNIRSEMSDGYECPKLISGLTLGVDTEVYKPVSKDRYSLLWASDPGRGVNGAIELAIKLFIRDNRYKLHLCWPDYADMGAVPNHPAIEVHKNLDNGQELWDLFNKCAFLPYTSTFKEPSSRAHRQAMSSGCVVLYPENMGTPSELITDGVNGIVGGSIDDWVEKIIELNNDWEKYQALSMNARSLAESENWKVQTKRFNEYFQGVING